MLRVDSGFVHTIGQKYSVTFGIMIIVVQKAGIKTLSSFTLGTIILLTTVMLTNS